MKEPNAANRKDQPPPTTPGKTSPQPKLESDPDSGTTGTGSSEVPKGNAFDVGDEQVEEAAAESPRF